MEHFLRGIVLVSFSVYQRASVLGVPTQSMRVRNTYIFFLQINSPFTVPDPRKKENIGHTFSSYGKKYRFKDTILSRV